MFIKQVLATHSPSVLDLGAIQQQEEEQQEVVRTIKEYEDENHYRYEDGDWNDLVRLGFFPEAENQQKCRTGSSERAFAAKAFVLDLFKKNLPHLISNEGLKKILPKFGITLSNNIDDESLIQQEKALIDFEKRVFSGLLEEEKPYFLKPSPILIVTTPTLLLRLLERVYVSSTEIALGLSEQPELSLDQRISRVAQERLRCTKIVLDNTGSRSRKIKVFPEEMVMEQVTEISLIDCDIVRGVLPDLSPMKKLERVYAQYCWGLDLSSLEIIERDKVVEIDSSSEKKVIFQKRKNVEDTVIGVKKIPEEMRQVPTQLSVQCLTQYMLQQKFGDELNKIAGGKLITNAPC